MPFLIYVLKRTNTEYNKGNEMKAKKQKRVLNCYKQIIYTNTHKKCNLKTFNASCCFSVLLSYL